MAQQTSPNALGHLRVIEVGGFPAACCGFWFGGLGADIIKIEPAEGDPWRRIPPFAGDVEDIERSLPHLWFNTNKRSVVLDLTTEQGKKDFRRLAATADVVVEAGPPGYLAGLGLGYDHLRRDNPGLVLVSITPWGQTGPHRDFKANDLISMAMGGLLVHKGGYFHRGPDGDENNDVLPCWQSYQLGGIYGAIGGMMALRSRRIIGRGQQVDIAINRIIPHTLQGALITYAYNGRIVPREGLWGASLFIVPAKDGYVSLMAGAGNMWKNLVAWVGDDPVLRDPKFEDRDYRAAHRDTVVERLAEFTKEKTVEYLTWEGQKQRFCSVPHNTVATFAEHPQTRAREFVVKHSHTIVGEYKAFGRPFLMAKTPWRFYRPAPRLGEHQEEVLGSLAPVARRAAAVPRGAAGNGKGKHLPLEGIRILDLTTVLAGPVGTQILGDFGAEVIKVESTTRDTLRQFQRNAPVGEDIHRSKYSVSLNLSEPGAREILKEMVKHADAIMDNFSAHVMDNFGLGYEDLRKINPKIIMLQSSGLGKTGPAADWRTYGHSLISHSGLGELWRGPDVPIPEHPHIAYFDYSSCYEITYALLSAIEHRERTGEGQYIEVAQSEGAAFMLGVAYLEHSINGRDWKPQGNASKFAAPHGTYRCIGHDKWVAIACNTEEEWQALAKAMGNPEWAKEEMFATLKSRLENRETLDALVSEWTRQNTPHQLMLMLQRAGVPCGAVQNAEDLYFDAQLRALGYHLEVDDPTWGRMTLMAPAALLSETPGGPQRLQPQIGQDNMEVLPKYTSLTPDQIKKLQEEKVVY
ncbi:MAG: CoA transferase [Chloroflexi bacterium]|nr:CoA transferase [Chloroflexota bacterium]